MCVSSMFMCIYFGYVCEHACSCLSICFKCVCVSIHVLTDTCACTRHGTCVEVRVKLPKAGSLLLPCWNGVSLLSPAAWWTPASLACKLLVVSWCPISTSHLTAGLLGRQIEKAVFCRFWSSDCQSQCSYTLSLLPHVHSYIIFLKVQLFRRL